MLLASLDLGRMVDFSALAIVEATGTECELPQEVYRPGGLSGPLVERIGTRWVRAWGPPVTCDVRYLQRWPLGTPYASIAGDVRRLLGQLGEPCALLADATGVGAACLELLRAEGLDPIPMVITAGRETGTGRDGAMLVPKSELVASVAVGLQAGRLRIARELPLAQVLAEELAGFELRVTSAANLTFGARSGAHDDLVLSVAMACYAADAAFRLPDSLPGVVQERSRFV